MTWNDFFAELASGNLRTVYLFTGTENFVKREALEKLRGLLPAGLEALNETVLEGADAAKIIEAAETLPMMCDRRLVVVRDWAPLMSGNARDEENESKKMIEYLGRMSGACTLVFYMRGEVDARKKLAADLNKRGATVDFSQLSDPDLYRWISSRLKPLKKKMSRTAMQQLVFVAGRELTRLDGELSKLAAFSGDRDAIDEADIEAVVSPSLEFGAFDMLNHLFEGDASGAYRLLDAMLERGSNRVVILSSITRQLRGMTHMGIAIENGVSTEETGRLLALHPFAAKVMAKNARKYSSEALEQVYQEALDADYAIKSGQARDSAALDRLFIKISSLPVKSVQPNGAYARQR